MPSYFMLHRCGIFGKSISKLLAILMVHHVLLAGSSEFKSRNLSGKVSKDRRPEQRHRAQLGRRAVVVTSSMPYTFATDGNEEQHVGQQGKIYDFKLLPKKEDTGFRGKDLQQNLRQWGLEDNFTVTQVCYSPAFIQHEETSFIRQLLAFVADKITHPNVLSGIGIQSVQWEALSCTAMSMNFFDCLIDKGIVTDSGRIRGCYDNTFDGISISDKLRELLVNPDTENVGVFTPDQERELIFHLFKALCIGGAICQPHDRLEVYLEAVKAVYKDLVSVRKSPTTGELEIAPCKVYSITGINDGGGNAVLSSGPQSPYHTCLVVLDLAKRRASVVRKEFIAFW